MGRGEDEVPDGLGDVLDQDDPPTRTNPSRRERLSSVSHAWPRRRASRHVAVCVTQTSDMEEHQTHPAEILLLPRELFRVVYVYKQTVWLPSLEKVFRNS